MISQGQEQHIAVKEPHIIVKGRSIQLKLSIINYTGFQTNTY